MKCLNNIGFLKKFHIEEKNESNKIKIVRGRKILNGDGKNDCEK